MGSEIGPVSSAALKEAARDGTITPDTFVRKVNSEDWVLAERVRGLFQSFQSKSISDREQHANPTPPTSAPRDVPTSNQTSELPAWYFRFSWTVAAGVAAGFLVGFFAGREYLRYEIRSNVTAASKGIAADLRSPEDITPNPVEPSAAIPILSLNETYRSEMFAITLTSVSQQPIEHEDSFIGLYKSDEPYLVCNLVIENLDARKILNLSGGSLSSQYFTLTDDAGNSFYRVSDSFGSSDIVGALSITDDIMPGTKRNHLEAFKLPPPNTKFLILQINLGCLDGDGWLRYKIPMAAVRNGP